MSVLLSAKRLAISLWHYIVWSFKMCNSTSLHIWTFVSPWQPWRRRSPVEIAARWRCWLPITNLTPHYNSQFCVSFYFCNVQEAADVYQHLGPKHNFFQFKFLFHCLYIKSWSRWHHLHAGENVRKMPSLPSNPVILFILKLSFSNGEVIQMWLARFRVSLGETSHTLYFCVQWKPSFIELCIGGHYLSFQPSYWFQLY